MASRRSLVSPPCRRTRTLSLASPSLAGWLRTATAHGALITSLASNDVSDFHVAFARPVIDLTADEPAQKFGNVIFPTVFQNVVSYKTSRGPRQNLVLIPAQFSSDEIGAGVQRLFTTMDTLVYYSDSDDFTPPTILRTAP